MRMRSDALHSGPIPRRPPAVRLRALRWRMIGNSLQCRSSRADGMLQEDGSSEHRRRSLRVNPR